MPASRIFFAVSLLLCFAATARGEPHDWPEWLESAVSLSTPANAAGAPGVVLLDETSLAVDAKGIAIEVHRFAIRILHVSGRSLAVGKVAYNGTSDKVLDADAWLLRDRKSPRPIKNSEWVDIAVNSAGAVIDEYRSRQVNISNDALTGDVFAYQTRVRRPLLVAQLLWSFSSDLPVITERVSLGLPAGFSIEEKIFGNRPPVASKAGNNTWIWTLSDRPFKPSEPFVVPAARVDAELMINFIVPAGSTGFVPHCFTDWGQVTKMYDGLNSGQCDSSAELIAKVHALTADHPDVLGKIQALGSFVQKLRYIEINQGLRYGFGWKARKASSVFSNGYGDCKDKANLLIAMLREAGIKSHLVVAMIDPNFGFVAHTECPTPVQFNHAIVGIEVDDAMKLPAVVATESSGRILFFDPTDPYTLVGDLPHALQGTKVHIATAECTSLTQLPEFSAKDDFLIERQVTLTLSPEGVIKANGKISGFGQSGAKMRYESELASLPKDLEQLVSNQLSDGFRGATVQEKKTEDNRLAECSTLSFACVHPHFVQRIQGNGMVVKLDILSRRYLPSFSDNTRTLPIDLHPAMVRDEIVLTLGDSQVVDELPAKISFETPYGNYQASFEIEKNMLVMKRTVVINRIQVPADDYSKVRRFFSDIARADRSSILLKPAG